MLAADNGFCFAGVLLDHQLYRVGEECLPINQRAKLT
jgi:hypothetical protein